MHPIPRCPILSPNPIGSMPPCLPTLLHADPPSASSQDHEFRISAVGGEEARRSSGMRGILAIVDFYRPGDDDDGSIAPARERSTHPFKAHASNRISFRPRARREVDAMPPRMRASDGGRRELVAKYGEALLP